MTPHLDRYLSKWALYKKCLILFLAVNVFSIVIALVLGFNYFTSKRNLGHRQELAIKKITNADTALTELHDFEVMLNTRTKIEVRTRQDEIAVLNQLSRWQEVKTRVTTALGENISHDISFFIPTAESRNTIKDLQSKLISVKNVELSSLQNNLKAYNDTTKLLIITGVLTLLFGVLLPHFVLYLMGRTLNHIRREIQNAALDFVKVWAETKAGFGDEAFKNVEFWLQILLLLGHQAGHMSSHPAAQITSELAHVVRLELKKKSTKKSAA